MKNIKQTIFYISAIATISVCDINADAQEYCGKLKYVTTEDKAIITGYTGNPKVLNIPAEIDGKKVVEVRENAFYKCESLEKVILPDTVKFVGHHAFYECASLKQAELSENIYSIDEGCFSGCISLEKIEFPNSLKIIESDGFYNCYSLESVELPSEVEEIGDYAFANCTGLYDVKLGENTLSVGDYSFINCGNLGEINLPSSVSSIGSCAFGYSDNIPLGDFKIKGDTESLGKMYAESNNLEFENTDYKAKPKKISPIPAMAVIASGAGLLFFQFLERLRGFKRKYEFDS